VSVMRVPYPLSIQPFVPILATNQSQLAQQLCVSIHHFFRVGRGCGMCEVSVLVDAAIEATCPIWADIMSGLMHVICWSVFSLLFSSINFCG